jgi:hypothetical protein
MKMFIMTLLLSSSAFARDFVITPGTPGIRIGGHTVQCVETNYETQIITCSAHPNGGIPYVGTGYSKREAKMNLKKYCITKKQFLSAVIVEECEQLAALSVCQ